VPPLTPNTVKAILQHTALVMPRHNVLTQWAGALNGGAVRLAAALDIRAPEGTLTAAANAGVDGVVRTRIRALFDDPTTRGGFVASVIAKQLSIVPATGNAEGGAKWEWA
jgi:hypothetical protein